MRYLWLMDDAPVGVDDASRSLRQPLVVVDYDPSWPATFETLRTSLGLVLADVALAIEHVGSTSVPGLAAKPVIDLDVVTSADRVRDCIERLVTLGYEHLGDLGIPEREAFRRPPDAPAHHLYVCVRGSLGLTNHLTIRDYLRQHPRAVRSYAELKKRLAQEHAGDVDAYTVAKTDFLVAILREAGLTAAPLAEIEVQNRS
jgi:GrpB-like predicted nucleotidyltransferase (UPF0157 family)